MRYPRFHYKTGGGGGGGGGAGAGGGSFAKLQALSSGVPFTGTLYRGIGTSPEEAALNRIPSQYGAGTYWSPTKEIAQTYGSSVRSERKTLRNPYVFRLEGKRPYYQELQRHFGTDNPQRITAQLKRQGYDSLVVKNVPVNRRGIARRDSIEIVVF